MRTARHSALTLAILATLAAPALAAETRPAIGSKVDNFTLRDYHGKPYSLAELAKDQGQAKIVVLAFLGTECPLAKMYALRLTELAKKFAPQGVVFVGINSNRQDAVTEIAAFARAHDITFPILKDLNQVVADSVGATRTPEVVVLDADRAIRYRGRIDDQYGFNDANANYQKPKAVQSNLADALTALTSGKQVAQAEAAPAGCLIGRDLKAVAKSDVTYTNHVARIMNANCVFCHREGQIAPFTLTSYEDVAGWAAMIDEVVRAERMPPWHANEKFGHFENDARLSDGDKATIAKWVENGAPEGDAKDLPKPPQFAKGWMIPKPDEVHYMRDKPYDVPSTGVVEYQMFVVDPGWKEDKWIAAIEPRPDNASVVHHILMFVIPPDGNIRTGLGGGNDFLAAFAPGLRPEPLPAGMARFVPAGSKLVFQMHYTPNGSPQKDRSYCGFVFADPKSVKKEVRVTSAINAVFQIPPGDSGFNVASRYIFTDDSLLLTMMPHMHLRGKAFRYEVTYPDGKKEVLLDVPRYDFGWQTNYRLTEPKLMPRGTRMDCYAVFDNSVDNLSNPNSKVPVRFGDQTFEEMMIGFFEVTPVAEDRQDPAKKPAELSRLERFQVILAATKGEPDDNIKVGAYMALSDPGIFRQYGQILQSFVPQVDRLCITSVKDGKLVEVMGPNSGGPGPHKKGEDDPGEEEINRLVIEARKKAAGGKEPPPHIFSPLKPLDVAGENLAEIAKGDKVVVYNDLSGNDLSQAKGKLFDEMRKRGVRSSLHVPAEIQGQRVTINFWSTDANAFPAPAEAILKGIAQIMTAPKDGEQAAAK